MSKIRNLRIAAVVVLGVVLTPMIGQATSPEEKMKGLNIKCIECHTCPDPTSDDACLKPCPSLTWAQSSSKHTLTEAPGSMLLNKLVDQYGPVHFNHKIHAEMSDMYKGCETCHHYSPPGHIPPCGQCHGGETNPANLRQPSLKGAYHRQCLCCHREWSHDTKCIICHTPAEGKILPNAGKDSTDIMGISHPVITTPAKKVYYTPYQAGAVVTFYHQQHIDLFGLRCVDCHQKENCGYCHDINKPSSFVKSQEEVHAVCSGCHDTDKCSKCHSDKERPGFTHASTGWRLNRFHANLSCRACHPTGRMISKLDTNCRSCHNGWNRQNFEHAVTSLQLDDIHFELDCIDCHKNQKYNTAPDCSDCHDDGRDHKSNPPGKYLKLTQR